MYCVKCGAEVGANNLFCGRCGTRIDTEPQNDYFAGVASAPAPVQVTSEPRSGTSLVTIVLGLLVLLFLGYVFIVQNSPSSPRSDTSRFSTPVTKHFTQQLVSGAHIVPASQLRYYRVEVTPDMRSARISGRYAAAGGSGNDIIVAVTDEDGLQNLQNGHNFNAWYSSGKVTAGIIDTRLGPGTYYLVFSNTFSIFSQKSFEANIKLDYDKTL